jgi:uncharacterized membrane protein YciS (DUF1049 family)
MFWSQVPIGKLYSKNILTVTNIVFLIGAVYFLALAALGQSSIYVVAPAILCIISFLLAARDDLFFSSPFRLSTCVSVLILLIAQEYVSLSSFSGDLFTVGTVLANGIMFFLFLGCTLSVARQITKVKAEEEEERTKDQARPTSKPLRQTS